MKPLSSIQALRALAALAVVMFHAFQWSNLDFAVGAAGVDLFFLISGFVLWLAAERSPVSPGAFLWARATRVAPLYWLWSLVAAGLAALWPRMIPVVHLDLGHALLSLAFIPHLDPWGGPWPLLPSGWTLTYEAFFYLVFALALTQPKATRLQILAVVLTIGAVLGFAYHRWYTLLANPLLLEFLAGAGLARAWARGPFAAGRPGLGLAAIALGVSLIAAQQAVGFQSDFWRPVVWGGPGFLILYGALRWEASGGLAGPIAAGLGRIGDASYSLYLCHLPVVAVVLASTPALPGPIRVALTIPCALLVGLACHAVVERPMTRALRKLPGFTEILPARA